MRHSTAAKKLVRVGFSDCGDEENICAYPRCALASQHGGNNRGAHLDVAPFDWTVLAALVITAPLICSLLVSPADGCQFHHPLPVGLESRALPPVDTHDGVGTGWK